MPSQEKTYVDFSEAMLGESIGGVEVAFDQHGTGARPACPLPVPKTMSPAQRELRDPTHQPHDDGCEICRATRGLNAKHVTSSERMRVIPLLVADYCFLRWSISTVMRTVLVMRVFPDTLYFSAWLPRNGLRSVCCPTPCALHQRSGLDTLCLSDRP